MWPFPLGLESGVELGDDGHRAALLIQNPNSSFRCVIAGVHHGLDLCDEEYELRSAASPESQHDNMEGKRQ